MITGTGWLLLWLVDAAVCGFLGAWIAERGGGSPLLGGLLGFVLGPIGVLVAAIVVAGGHGPDAETGPELEGECPYCKRDIRLDTLVCPYCQRELTPLGSHLQPDHAAWESLEPGKSG